jgi:hypothetical protein
MTHSIGCSSRKLRTWRSPIVTGDRQLSAYPVDLVLV